MELTRAEIKKVEQHFDTSILLEYDGVQYRAEYKKSEAYGHYDLNCFRRLDDGKVMMKIFASANAAGIDVFIGEAC